LTCGLILYYYYYTYTIIILLLYIILSYIILSYIILSYIRLSYTILFSSYSSVLSSSSVYIIRSLSYLLLLFLSSLNLPIYLPSHLPPLPIILFFLYNPLPIFILYLSVLTYGYLYSFQLSRCFDPARSIGGMSRVV
jgi:hypothetical protein